MGLQKFCPCKKNDKYKVWHQHQHPNKESNPPAIFFMSTITNVRNFTPIHLLLPCVTFSLKISHHHNHHSHHHHHNPPHPHHHHHPHQGGRASARCGHVRGH